MSTKLSHTVPTHLEVKDKVFLGLEFYQFTWLFAGLGLAAFLYNAALVSWPVILKLAASGLVISIVLALVLIRPNGDSLSDWLFDRLYYFYSPQAAFYGLLELADPENESSLDEDIGF